MVVSRTPIVFAVAIVTALTALNLNKAHAMTCCGGDSVKSEDYGSLLQQKPTWHAQLTGGWDSLYMFRGVNMLGRDSKYGAGLFWANLSTTFKLTPDDLFQANVWNALGMGHMLFQETDLCLMYTHNFGNLFVTLGYMMMAMNSMEMYCNELHGKIGYNLSLGPVTVVPSVTYFFNLGPNASTSRYGMAPSASSFLSLRTDFSIPLYKDVIKLTPWVAYAQNFRFNARTESDGTTVFFNGPNNFELGVALPIKIRPGVILSGYGAYSYGFDHLVGTEPSTFWGGAKITFAF